VELRDGSLVLTRCSLGSVLTEGLRRAGAEGRSLVFLVRNEDLDRIADWAAVADRGRRHRSRQLWKALFRSRIDPVAVIRTGYARFGDVENATRDLLVRSQKRPRPAVFGVGLDEPQLLEGWARAEEAGLFADPDPAEPNDEPGLEPTPLLCNKRSATIEHLPVPQSVRNAYVGKSKDVRHIWQLVLRALKSTAHVLIEGETGTGKDLLARLIHDLGPRRARRFIPVNCAAIPSELLEGMLFGHMKDSHSTATERKIGLWQAADGGTLFLNEVASLSPDHQAKLLQILEEGAVWPVGALEPVKVDVRVIAAGAGLREAVASGRFRADLYQRLSRFPIETPTLRDHPEDLALLATHFWRLVTGNPRVLLPAEIIAKLRGYSWPYNARELKHFLENLSELLQRTDGLNASHIVLPDQPGLPNTAARARDRTRDRNLSAVQARHAARCLRHLRRAAQALRRCKVGLRRLIVDRRTDVETASLLGERLASLLGTFAKLCRDSFSFYTYAAADRVREAEGVLASLKRYLEVDPRAALRFWESVGATAHRRAERAVFAACHRIMEIARTRPPEKWPPSPPASRRPTRAARRGAARNSTSRSQSPPPGGARTQPDSERDAA
jgi:DNA-binding NtrC family response regulator